MSLLYLLLPFISPLKGILWLGEKIREIAETEFFDKSRVNAELLELQMLYEMGEMPEEEFKKLETGLLERLEEIRRYEGEKK